MHTQILRLYTTVAATHSMPHQWFHHVYVPSLFGPSSEGQTASSSLLERRARAAAVIPLFSSSLSPSLFLQGSPFRLVYRLGHHPPACVDSEGASQRASQNLFSS